MKSIFYSMLVAGLLIAGCSQDKKGKEIPLKYSDQTYTLVKKGDGELPKPGEFSVFSLMITGDDGKVLLDRTEESNYGSFQIPADSASLNKVSPIYELLTCLSKGDSAVLVYELDSLAKTNPAVMGLNSLTYNVSIKDVMTMEQVEQRQKEINAERDKNNTNAKERGKVVADRLAEVLAAYKSQSLGAQLKSTESGLQYVIEKQGEGPKPSSGTLCNVHYYGVLESNGEMFDNSYQRGEYFNFPVGQQRVIKGWDEALLLMNRGTEAIFFIPYELAYGAAGRPPMIPEKANLVFYIEYP